MFLENSERETADVYVRCDINFSWCRS